MCEISIIVPVYKVEKYLEKCVNSILAQTFTNFELILVDDGSPDRSGAMCDEYAQKDPRVKVIHKENGGLSSARNAGIDVARGRYLGFVDSDDYIAADMYELLHEEITRAQADLAICGIYDIYEGKEPVEKPIIHETATADEALLLILQGNNISVHAVNKLYRRELFQTLRYPVGKYHEDSFIIVDLLAKCQKIAINSAQKYFYYHRLGSINTEKFSDKQFEFIEAWEINERKLKGKGQAIESAAHQRVCFARFMVLDKIFSANAENQVVQTNDLIKDLQKDYLFILKDPTFTRNRKIAMTVLMFSRSLYKKFVLLQRQQLAS